MGKVEGGHDPAGEEMVRDPVCRIGVIEAIRPVSVREDMQEKLAVRPQPGPGAVEEVVPVRHMLEHFDGDDPVVMILRREAVHVGRDHGQVCQTLITALPENELAL